MAEDKYKTPQDMQEIYDRDQNKNQEKDRRMRDAAGNPEKVREAVQDEIKDRRLKGKEFFDKITSYIDSGVQTVAQTAATDDPDSYLDDIARGALGTAQFVGNVASTPGISHTLRLLDSPFWAARQAAGGALEHGFGVDPRYGHAAVGVGEFFVGGKALTKAGKVLDNVANPQIAYALSKGSKVADQSDALFDLQRQQAGLKMRLLKNIDGQGELFDPNIHYNVRNYVEAVKRVRKPRMKMPGDSSSVQLSQFFPWELGSKGFVPLKSKRYWGTLPSRVQRTIKMDAGNLGEFKKNIWSQMELDDIRVNNVTLRGLGRKSKLENFGGVGFGELYYDYLGAHFDRWGNLRKAAQVELPNGTIVKPSVYNTRGQKLERINPEQKGKFYQGSKLSKKEVKVALELPDSTILESHHLDMIAASYPLYHGLDKKQRGIVKKLIEDAGIFTGDNPRNRWDLDPVVHDRVHIFLEKELRSRGIDKLDQVIVGSKFKTAASRKEYIQKYIEAINKTKEEIKIIVTDQVQKTDAADLSKLSDKQLDEYVTKLERAKDIYDR